MKKYLLHSIFVFVAILLVYVTSCKKNDDNTTGQNPANAFSIVKQEMNDYSDTSKLMVMISYENNRLSSHHYYADGESISKSNYTYSGEDRVNRLDTLYYNNTKEAWEVQYRVENNLIVESFTSDDLLQTAEYSYEGENITKWEYFGGNASPVAKGEYEYQGGNLTSYSYYSMDNEGAWDHTSKSEYTYQDGKRHEMLFYIRFDETTEPDLTMKRQYSYNGELVSNMLTYFRTLEDEWYVTYNTYFEYDGNGNLIKVTEYATDGTNEVLSSDISYTLEQGESNMEMFYKIQNNVLVLDPGYPVWGFHSASTRVDFMKKKERFIIR